MIRSLFTWAFGFTLVTAVAALAAVAPPRQKFLAAFAPLDGGPAAISPDGKHVAFFEHVKGDPAVFLVNLESAQTVFRAVIWNEGNWRRIGNTDHIEPLRRTFLRWADNRRVVVATNYNQFLVLDLLDRTGRQLVNLNGEEMIVSGGSGMLDVKTVIAGRRTGRVVALLPGEPPVVVIEATAWTVSGRTENRVLTLNVETGKVESFRDESVVGRLLYDPEGRVRGYYRTSYVVDPVFLRNSRSGKERWSPLDELHPLAASPRSPLKGATFFGDKAFPIGVAGNLLYFASNVGRATLGLYALNLETGKQTSLAIESSVHDLAAQVAGPAGLSFSTLVVDRTSRAVVGVRVQGLNADTHWLDPELATIQAALKARYAGFTVTIVDWDNTRDRFVFAIHSRADPGAYLMYRRSNDTVQRIVAQRATQPTAKSRSAAWTLNRSDGGRLSGWLTLPDTPTSAPARPVVVRLAGPWLGATDATNFEVIALSQMGYAVLEVNHRGISGLGTAHLQAGRHRIDVVAAEDIVSALDALAPKAGLDQTRVALLGSHFGAYLALRALQLQPGRFACAVTNEPVANLELYIRPRIADSDYHRFVHEANQWFFGADKTKLRAASPINDPASVRVPIFLGANPDIYHYNWSDPRALRRKLTAAGNPPAYFETTSGINLPGAEQARFWGEVEDFLKRHFEVPADR